MKLRVQHDRTDCRQAVKLRDSPTVMQSESSERGARAGNGLSPSLPPERHARTPSTGHASPTASSPASNEVRIPMSGGSGEAGGASSWRSRATHHSHSHAHAHSHSHARQQRHSHTEPDPADPEHSPTEPDGDLGEPTSSLSELGCLLRWIQRSLPFLVILCSKLVIQHALGLAVGAGLFTTFLYVNKNIQTQVFLQDRHSKLQCIWLLLFLVSSTLLLYYTFPTQTLYNCLIFLSPAVEPLGFWEVLWAVGITNFIIKFLYMGIKCLILLFPSSLVSYRTQGRWLMLTEELSQVHQTVAPVPLWFRYLVTYQEVDGTPGLTLGILLALLYLILKLLGLYSQWTPLLKTMRIFLKGERTETTATRSQCSEAGDICPICQGEFREPRALICQHIFCDECIALWFNREKSCPLCRTVITEKVYKWRDGATSPHLQVY